MDVGEHHHNSKFALGNLIWNLGNGSAESPPKKNLNDDGESNGLI